MPTVAIPVCGGIVLLMERLNKIIELNTEGMYLVTEAGVPTIEVQRVANEAGYLYAGDPCSADSCLIGGNLATNAGGNKAVRYGTTRDQVHEIEFVSPTGEIIEVGARLKKMLYRLLPGTAYYGQRRYFGHYYQSNP